METSPAYRNICASSRGFNLFKKTAWTRMNAYPGIVAASADAFYFAVNVHQIRGGMAAIGGAVGGAVAGYLAGRKTAEKRRFMPQPVPLVEEMDLAELPAEVTGHPDWPVTWREGPVIVVPRAAVILLRTSFWMGGIDVEVQEVVLRVFTPIFKRKQMGAYLIDHGWEVQGM